MSGKNTMHSIQKGVSGRGKAAIVCWFLVIVTYILCSSVYEVSSQSQYEAACDPLLRPVVVSDVRGQITFTNYSSPNRINLDCYWLIASSLIREKVQISFSYLQLSTNERMYLYDGANITSRVLANLTSNSSGTFISSGPNMLLRLASGPTPSAFDAGFNATYWLQSGLYGAALITACDPLYRPLTITTSSGVITSPNYPSPYNNSMDCRWLITAPYYLVVTISFSVLQMETNYDFVYLYDGSSINSRLMASLSSLPYQTYTTSQMYLLVRMTSDSSVTAIGFSATFATSNPSPPSSSSSTTMRPPSSNSACDPLYRPLTITESSGVITSPNYPLSYNDNMDCRWLVTAPYYLGVTISFTVLQMETNYDFVYLYDGSSINSRLMASLSSLPYQSYTTSQMYLLVRMTSDGSSTNVGFYATFATSNPSPPSSSSGSSMRPPSSDSGSSDPGSTGGIAGGSVTGIIIIIVILLLCGCCERAPLRRAIVRTTVIDVIY